jgi:hypothetical protein
MPGAHHLLLVWYCELTSLFVAASFSRPAGVRDSAILCTEADACRMHVCATVRAAHRLPLQDVRDGDSLYQLTMYAAVRAAHSLSARLAGCSDSVLCGACGMRMRLVLAFVYRPPCWMFQDGAILYEADACEDVCASFVLPSLSPPARGCSR